MRFKQANRVIMSVCFVMASLSFATAQTSDPRAGGFTQADRELLTRQQIRMDTFEESLKELRGQVELEVKNTRTQLEKLSSSLLASTSGTTVNAQEIRSELARLNDSIAILNQRLARTIEMSSDVEFRVLRLEKRLSTLLQLSDPSVSERIVQDDVTGAGVPADVTLSKDSETGQTVWTIDKSELDAQLYSVDNQTDTDAPSSVAADTQANTDNASALQSTQQEAPETTETVATPGREQDLSQQQPVPEPMPQILPDVSPEEQYRFALGRALQNDLGTAEQAFSEFRTFNAEHERASDALFWLGRVQFMLGKFEDSAVTFSEFNTNYASDPRLVETTLWIAESVAQFAETEQACDVYETLTQLLDEPPESFTKRITELSADCPAR